MNKTISWVLLVHLTTLMCIISLCFPEYLGNENKMVENFNNNILVNFLGIVVTITISSSLVVILELNKMEKEIGKKIFIATKSEIKQSCTALILSIFISVLLLFSKGTLNQTSDSLEQYSAVYNGLLFIVLSFDLLILADITHTIFKIESVE